ncbi:MAG: signal peptidase II [Planctomycetaceae bacterium]|nr:signal peptidase II [Planctomycetaceae bacterium]
MSTSTQATQADAARPEDPGERPAWRSPAAWATLAGVFAGGLALDLWSKYWAFRTIAGYPVELERERVLNDASFFVPHHARWIAIPGDLLDFRLVLNHGAVFGIGQHRRELFIVFTIIATVAAVALFARGTRVRMHASHVAIGMILAGGIGNLYDRIFYGAVRDFLHMLPEWELPFGWRWPGNANAEVFPWVFNVADVLLLAGMSLFVLTSWLEDRRARRLASAASASGPSADGAKTPT